VAVFDFSTAAWIGRAVGWALLAWGWESLLNALGLYRARKCAATICLLALMEIANLSGEWLAGGIEAKVPAYALVFFALSRAVQARWAWVWPLLGLATGFHPLVGGWSLLAAAFARMASLRRNPFEYPESSSIAVGILFAVALGVFPTYRLEWDSEPLERASAATIYVRERINHHLYFWDFPRSNIVGFGLLVAGWIWLDRIATAPPGLRVVKWFATGSLALVGLGILLSNLSNQEASQRFANALLRLYWFRLADVAIPVAVALLIAATGRAAPATRRTSRQSAAAPSGPIANPGGMFLAATVIAAFAICGWTVVDRWRDGRPGADRQSLPAYADQPRRTWETQQNWVRVCRWIAENTPERARFVTPRNQQTFKWYAQRTEYVNWKDIPQDARSICEWSRRMSEVYGSDWGELVLPYLSSEQRRVFLAITGTDYVVIEQSTWRKSDLASDESFTLVYPAHSNDQTTYVVLRVK
jgi:hypothetical protein